MNEISKSELVSVVAVSVLRRFDWDSIFLNDGWLSGADLDWFLISMVSGGEEERHGYKQNHVTNI